MIFTGVPRASLGEILLDILEVEPACEIVDDEFCVHAIFGLMVFL